MQSMKQYCNADGEMSLRDLREFLRVFTERHGVRCKSEALLIVAKKFVVDDDCVTRPGEVLEFFQDELRRKEWVVVGKRLRWGFQRAAIVGVDPEQLLSQRDVDRDHYISATEFKSFLLNDLAKFGKLSPKDVNMIVNHFSRRPNKKQHHEDRDPISLREVMAFVGRPYVGNIQVNDFLD